MALAAFGCAKKEVRAPAGPAPTRSVARTALTQLGAPYRWGGQSPETGFDCSGLTGWVFRQHGLDLPREAGDQYRAGRAVDRDKLRPGDLVFFRISGWFRKTDHVGIYLGNDRFIHAAKTNARVEVSRLSESYWSKRFRGARRVLD